MDKGFDELAVELQQQIDTLFQFHRRRMAHFTTAFFVLHLFGMVCGAATIILAMEKWADPAVVGLTMMASLFGLELLLGTGGRSRDHCFLAEQYHQLDQQVKSVGPKDLEHLRKIEFEMIEIQTSYAIQPCN